MDLEIIEMYDMKLRARQQRLIGAFWVNIVMIAIVWLLTWVPGLISLGSIMTGLSHKMMHIAIIGGLGVWGVLAFAFFLAPAMAIIRTRRGIVAE